MNELALFAGAGGGILGGHLLGWRTVCAVERDAYAAQVLAQRQIDGCLPAFPIWSDVCSFDGRPWRGLVDVVSGGFPCQDISAAGNGAGIDGERSSLWREMARIVGEVRPRFVFVENSPLLVGRGLAVVLGDLAELGYDAQWFRLSASDCGAPHQRDRVWIVANAKGERRGEARELRCLEPAQRAAGSGEELADPRRVDEQGQLTCKPDPKVGGGPQQRPAGPCRDGFGRWPAEPHVGRVADGVAHRVDRLKALGNGQVPRVAAAAFRTLSGQE
ncbi:DNA cytosine methyltransferase [Stutzerimonas nitrititolerans]|uniref:DNA cytosine methyltransferase n=1 Tax=Stutzerimonas nitrititolerans TaxID=2482751 RepID=UPI002899064A|nr:DNA cytosine methyltransferase [Stutzerimonas nitrititolerans]